MRKSGYPKPTTPRYSAGGSQGVLRDLQLRPGAGVRVACAASLGEVSEQIECQGERLSQMVCQTIAVDCAMTLPYE